MGALKDEIIRLIGDRAEKEAAYLAGEFARAASKDREDLLAAVADSARKAGLEF